MFLKKSVATPQNAGLNITLLQRYLPSKATALLRPFSSVPKVAVVD